MPIQTTYSFSHDLAVEGMETGLGIKEAITAYSAAAIAFGRGVVFANAVGANDRRSVSVASAAISDLRNFVGVTRFVHKQNSTGTEARLDSLTTTEDSRYEIGDDITVVRKGMIYVYSETAVDYEDPVHIRYATGAGGTVLGRFRNAAVTDETTDLSALPLRWACRTSEAGLAVLEINLP